MESALEISFTIKVHGLHLMLRQHLVLFIVIFQLKLRPKEPHFQVLAALGPGPAGADTDWKSSQMDGTVV